MRRYISGLFKKFYILLASELACNHYFTAIHHVENLLKSSLIGCYFRKYTPQADLQFGEIAC